MVLRNSSFPLLERRGGCAIKKKNPFRKGADGVVALVSIVLRAAYEPTKKWAPTTSERGKHFAKNSVTPLPPQKPFCGHTSSGVNSSGKSFADRKA